MKCRFTREQKREFVDKITLFVEYMVDDERYLLAITRAVSVRELAVWLEIAMHRFPESPRTAAIWIWALCEHAVRERGRRSAN